MLSTSQVRAAWGPACSGTKVSLTEAYQHLNAAFHRWNYAPRQGVTGAMNCRPITGGSGYSLHAFGPGGYFTFYTGVRVTMALACDVNWDKNPYKKPPVVTDMPRGMVNEITAIRTNNGKQVWGWGGNYGGGNVDAMHYEIVCAPGDLATGIGGSTPTAPPTHAGQPNWVQIHEFLTAVRNNLGGMGTLRQGSATKHEVSVLQVALNYVSGTSNLTVDGDWGAATDKAVRAFQTIMGLEVDGVVGDATRFWLITLMDKKLAGG